MVYDIYKGNDLPDSLEEEYHESVGHAQQI